VKGSGEDAPSLRIDRVLSGSPAAKAGVQAGDRIVRLRGKAVERRDQALAALAETHPGEPVTLTVRRRQGSKAEDIALTIKAGEGL
jgi:S1-C subfamily serine protease